MKATNVSTGKPNVAGAIYRAPKGTALPTDATSALSDAYKGMGFISDSGVENDNEMNVNEIKAWGGVYVYRSLESMNDEFKFAMIETENVEVLKTVYGANNVTVDAQGNVEVKVIAEDPEEAVWVIDMALRGGVPKRIVIPEGAITAREAITYNDSDPIAHGITVSGYPHNEDGYGGATHKEYIAGIGTPSV